jgi:hypothetical protein
MAAAIDLFENPGSKMPLYPFPIKTITLLGNPGSIMPPPFSTKTLHVNNGQLV